MEFRFHLLTSQSVFVKDSASDWFIGQHKSSYYDGLYHLQR